MTENEIKLRILEMAQLKDDAWESLCKGCGICCLLKHSRREGTYYTGVACNSLDLETKRCTIYSKRLKHGITCRKVDLAAVLRSGLLPDTCGYIEYIYGKSDKKINVDFKKIMHEQDLSKPVVDLSGLEFSNASVHPYKYRTVPGPWDFIIKDSLKWRERSMELREKYEDFSRELLIKMQKQQKQI